MKMKRVFRFVKALWKYMLYGHRVSLWTYCDRLGKCNGCDKFRGGNWTCGVCGCYLDKKAKMNTERCPEGKW
jgi:hypothetical protein